MIIKLSKEEIEQAVIAWVALRMDFDYQEHDFNTVDFKYSTPRDGCEVSWVEPAEPEAT
jgi:hypothetical protein